MWTAGTIPGLFRIRNTLREKLAGALRADTSGTPEYWENLAEGKRLALAKGVGDESTEAGKFWFRSFLYAGLARHRKRPFVPDTICSRDMEGEENPLTDYSQQLIQAIDAKYSLASSSKTGTADCDCYSPRTIRFTWREVDPTASHGTQPWLLGRLSRPLLRAFALVLSVTFSRHGGPRAQP